MTIRRVACLLWAVCLCDAAAAPAGQVDYETARLERRLTAVRAAGAIVVDGALDEPDWSRAPIAAGFIQNDPREGEPASEETEVRVLYDADNLYVGVLARDRDPAAILTSELAKDFNRQSGDDFEIVLDTFHDGRNGYMFATNARGARWDAQMINEGREINENWDALWQVRTRTTQDGWYAEIAIPFRTLRFGSAPTQTWGVNFQRRVRRRNEDSFWAPLPRIYDLTRVSLAGTLEGLDGVRPGNDLRIKPYVLGSSGASSVVAIGTDADAGVDVKFGLTSGLTWDFTVNTDFSQVEADEQQVNLTRFSLFFPEKRDFFLENSGVFQFGQGAGLLFTGGGTGTGGGFFPPRGQDAILFFSRRIGLSAGGESIPILGGTRLTGRAGEYSVGLLTIQQRSTRSSPAANVSAFRLRRNVLANSDIGVLVLNKEADGPASNRLAGADANFRFFEYLNLNAAAARTFSPAAAVPGDGSESMGRVGASYRDTRWDLTAFYLRIGERFNDEMGFVPRIGISKFESQYGVRFRPRAVSRWFREAFPHVGYMNVDRLGGDLQSRLVQAHLSLNFQDGSGSEMGVEPATENLVEPFVINRRRGIAIPPGRYEFSDYFITWRTNSSAPLSFNGRVDTGEFYDGYKQSYLFGTAVRLKGRLNAAITESRNQIRLRAGAYTTDLITARVEYGFSTVAFVNALVQYNTDAREWSSNLRFNIIHRPLSDIYLVFNERRDTGTGGLIDRAFVAKMTYMVAF
ncbi:MAG: carbohydrate binding family 9 domain-containing protein [Acidobacteria bacterium]|nr:carbohydrate binding family 9 domain-containing protein [Acidobacteriota bacterium]